MAYPESSFLVGCTCMFVMRSPFKLGMNKTRLLGEQH